MTDESAAGRGWVEVESSGQSVRCHRCKRLGGVREPVAVVVVNEDDSAESFT